MIKDLCYLLGVCILSYIILSLVIHTNFTCSFYNVEYKNVCLHLLGD